MGRSAAVILLAAALGASAYVPAGAGAPVVATGAAGAGRLDATTLVNWPCPGCIVQLPAGYRPGKPAALLVALHGDEGAPTLIAETLGPIASVRNTILFAPQCPTALGCRLANGPAGFTNSWWGWLQSSPTYDDAWLGKQIDLVESRYSVDRAHEYLFGWSGGADYMGWYALKDGARFAGAAFVSGGVPYVQTCPSGHLAAYFLLGGADPRYLSGQPSAVRSVLARCGDVTKEVVLPGADHQGAILALQTRGYAATILTWLARNARR